MAQLAIKGHATRGKEVIKILKMLGGYNMENWIGDDEFSMYFINKDRNIIPSKIDYSIMEVFTLEEFLEKFPYKVGDKVKIPNCVVACSVTNMIWNGIDMEYKTTNSEETFFDDELQPYKEETMEKEKKYYDEWLLTEYLEFEDNDGVWADEVEVNLGKDYEIQIRGDKTFIVKKKSQYPKTYEECAKVLLERASVRNDIGYKGDLIVTLQKLLVCRDAYWKIAGEQMGLGKPWKPDWEKADEIKYCIVNTEGNVAKWVQKTTNKILAFPTEEMRDAFYENFKDLIEACKELL